MSNVEGSVQIPRRTGLQTPSGGSFYIANWKLFMMNIDRKEMKKWVETWKKAALSLEEVNGKGFSVKNVRQMMRFAKVFPDEQIVSALRRQLSWTHFKSIIYMAELPADKQNLGEVK
ncbi:MAG: DUF1016 domain-containing protein [Gammaproteobacteria bacterium]|nr:DUF1016 domain-containing protein [Gammaproteobacteria bacterium]